MGALRSVTEHNSSSEEASRRRKPPVTCWNDDGTKFKCAGGDKCCGGACVGEGDVCCENVNGDSFPCQGKGGGCCGNACYAPGSKCRRPEERMVPSQQGHPVQKSVGDMQEQPGQQFRVCGWRPVLWRHLRGQE